MLSAWLIGEAIKLRVYNATEATWSAGRYMLMKIIFPSEKFYAVS